MLYGDEVRSRYGGHVRVENGVSRQGGARSRRSPLEEAGICMVRVVFAFDFMGSKAHIAGLALRTPKARMFVLLAKQ